MSWRSWRSIPAIGEDGDAEEGATAEGDVAGEEVSSPDVGMLKRIPGLASTTPWILKDFRSPRRQIPFIQDDFNRKGLISDKGQKKKAYYVLRDWYESIARGSHTPE